MDDCFDRLIVLRSIAFRVNFHGYDTVSSERLLNALCTLFRILTARVGSSFKNE